MLTGIILIITSIIQLYESLFQANKKVAITTCKLVKKATRVTRCLIKRSSIANMYEFGKEQDLSRNPMQSTHSGNRSPISKKHKTTEIISAATCHQ